MEYASLLSAAVSVLIRDCCLRLNSVFTGAQNFGEYMQTVDLENRVDSKISAVLEKEMEMAYQHHPLRNKCEKTATWAEWCHETNATIPDDPDDDLQLASGAQFKNMRCNVTTKSIFELDDPVEDAQGYIYEKAAIMQLITQHGGRVQNPAKRDANLFVTAAELVPCRRVQREAQRRRKEQQSQADNAEEIL